MRETKERARPHECQGGLTFDPVTGIVTRLEGSFALRHKSQRLLSYLIENRDRPISREELLDQIWEGAAVSEATVTGCLKEIRRALGDDAREPVYIRTLAKKGYWWVAPMKEPPPAAPPPAEPAEPPRPAPRAWLAWAFASLALAGLAAVYLVWSQPDRRQTRPWGELAWWPLDEASGGQVRERIQGWTAALPAGVRWTQGVQGAALAFEGAASGIRGIDPGVLPRGAEPRTITAWVRSSGPRADTSTLFQYGMATPAGPGDAFALRFDQIGRAGFANGGEWFAPRRLDDGRWHFLAAVFESGPNRRLRLYVDGVEEGDRSLPPQQLGAGGPTEWSLGRPVWGGTPFRGELDDVRVYGHALNAGLLRGLHACRVDSPGLDIGGQRYYYTPIFKDGIQHETGGAFTHVGLDVGGFVFVQHGGDCALQKTRASDLGQDLLFEMEIQPGGQPEGPLTESGPFFRSRPAAAGDGIMGGTSAGFWVQLQSNGQVLVRRLHPIAVVAFSRPVPGFDPRSFHRLRVEARGSAVEVALDSRPVEFDHAGERLHRVPLAPLWQTANPPGRNAGAAGIAFSCMACRGQAGGQRVRGLRVTRL